MKKLSECKQESRFASCENCKEVFVDDLPQWGSIQCPECGYALLRGVNEQGHRTDPEDS